MIKDHDQVAAKLKIVAPSVDIADLEEAVFRYREVYSRPGPPPKTINDEIERLARSTQKFSEQLYRLHDETSDLLAFAAAKTGSPISHKRELIRQLEILGDLTEVARRDNETLISKGRGISAITKLVWRLAACIEDAGGSVNAKKNGELVQTFGLAVDQLELSIKNERETVRAALASKDANQTSS